MNAVHVEAIEQVAAEVAAIDRALDVEIGGREKADVDVPRLVLADAAHLAGFERPQQLGLQRLRHGANLVEEERASVRVLDQPRPRRGRAGEGAARVAEQLVLEQRFGERRAIQGDERLRRRGC